MAKYELPIYGKDDEIIKTYATNIVPWAIFIKAAEMEETLKNLSAKEQMNAVGDILKDVFVGLNDADLMRADGLDVMNTFAQIVNGGQKINGGSKNAQGARG